MGLMDYGQGAQAFTDNFLKTYMAIGEDRRAEEAQKIAKQMAEAKLAEYAREQAMQAEAQQLINSYQQPASATFRNPNAFNMTQNQPPVNGLLSSIQGLNQPIPMMNQANPMGFLALSNNNPTIQRQFPSKIDMLRATGRDPETEILSSLQNVVAKYDPAKGVTLMANAEGKNNALMQALVLAQMRDATANRGIDVRESLGNQANETRLDIAKLRAELAEKQASQKVNAPTLKFQNDYVKAVNKRDELGNQLDDISTHADRLLNSRLDRITGIKGVMPNIPGGAGADAQASLDSFKSKIGLSTLANLKSGTGAGLGQVTEAEHKLLQNYLSELENAQSEKSIRESITRIKEWSQSAKDRINRGFDRSIYGQYDKMQNGEQPSGGIDVDKSAIQRELDRRKRK